MSRVETPTGAWAMDVEPSREGIVGRSLLAAFASVVALWPYVPVVQAGQWSLIVGTLIFVVTLIGAIVRVLMADRSAPARTLTLALSDVVGDDLSVIASGPTVPDDSTFARALHVLEGEIERSRARGDGPETERALRHQTSVLLHGPSVRARELAAEGRGREFEAALDAMYGLRIA